MKSPFPKKQSKSMPGQDLETAKDQKASLKELTGASVPDPKKAPGKKKIKSVDDLKAAYKEKFGKK